MLALALATVVAAVGLLIVPSPVTTSASPVQNCTTTSLLEECPTTTNPVVTTSLVVSTTSTVRSTSTTARATTTTARQSSNTVAPTTTTLPPTTSNILVPGDGTDGAESTTTTLATATKVSDGGPSDGTLIGLVIAGLVLVAVAVAILTWRYWLATRPPPLGAQRAAKPGPRPAARAR